MGKNYSAMIGEKIKKHMNLKGLSQKELAEEVGIDPASLCRIISGEKNPKSDILANLATVLGVSSDYLLGIENEKDFDASRHIRLLARNKNKLTPEDKRELIELLTNL